MFTGALRAVRRNLLSIIVLGLVCLAISGFIPQGTPELKAQKRRAGASQELEQFMGSKPSKANMSGAQQLVDNAIKQDKVLAIAAAGSRARVILKLSLILRLTVPAVIAGASLQQEVRFELSDYI